MIQSNRDEILIKYAQHSAITKQAWDWVDVAQALSLDALIGGTIGGGSAALGGTSIGAGILSGVGLASNPIGWVLLAGGVAATIYAATRQTDDNLEDLIDRFKDLDPNPKMADRLANWIQELEMLQNNLQVEEVASDPETRMIQLGNQVNNITAIMEKLQAIRDTWPQVKPNLTDSWDMFDIGQAETALMKTTQAIEQQFKQIQQEAQKEKTKLLQTLSQKAGVDYNAVAKRIVDLHNYISKISGQTLVYETDEEQAAFNLASAIIAGKTEELSNINIIGPSMVNLAKGLENLLKQEQAKQPKQPKLPVLKPKSSTSNPAISKRAVRLSGTKPTSKPGAPSAVVVKDPLVQEIQRLVNYLNLNLKTGVGRIGEDGLYGNQTAQALYILLDKFQILDNILQRYVGLDKDSVKNFELMKEDRNLVGVRNVLNSIAQQIMATVAQTVKQPQEQQTGFSQVQTRDDKENPTDAEILALLNRRSIVDPETRQGHPNAYEYLSQGKGWSDIKIVQVIHKLFGGKQARDWDMRHLESELTKGSRYGVF